MTAQPQHLVALDRANRVRVGMAQLKRLLRSGELTVAEALEDPRAAPMRIEDVLRAQIRWGRAKANATLRRARVSEGRRVGELTERQRGVVAHAVEHGFDRSRQEAQPKFPELGDRDWLVNLYVTEGWNTAQIAAEVGCSTVTVLTWLHRHEVTVAASPARRSA